MTSWFGRWRQISPAARGRRRLIITLGALMLTVCILTVWAAPPRGTTPSFTFSPVYTAGQPDAAGQMMGGTEIRGLVAYGGLVFAGNGYWKDMPGEDHSPGAQILVRDAPSRAWHVDHAFDDTLPRGRRRHLAVSALAVANFRTDQNGASLPVPVSLLLASTWDVTGARTVFVRNEHQAIWSGTLLAQDRPSPGFLPQIRSFGTHRDRVTGTDLVFAGDTRGVFAGAYDPALPGSIHWRSMPELTLADAPSVPFPGLSGRVRISSFAEAEGHLFAAIGQQIWVREDGAMPHWRVLYTNPTPAYSQTGLRGLTAVTAPGGGEALLAAIEGQRSRIVRINPDNGAETTDLDLGRFLDAAWGTRVSYVIAAYNDMMRLPGIDGGGALLIGLEAFIPPDAPRPPAHTILDVVHGIEGGGWFLLRHPDGRYELHQVKAVFPGIGLNLVAVRSAVPSPFPNEAGVFYVGGYDANDTPAHNTAWIARGEVNRDHP